MEVMLFPATGWRSPEEYVEIENLTDSRNEYWNGKIVALGGSPLAHCHLTAALTCEVSSRLKSPFRACGVGFRILVEATGVMLYPDLSIFREPAPIKSKFTYSFMDPIVLVEVLAPESESRDRGSKFDHYRLIPAPEEYILVSSEHHAIDHFRRAANEEWALSAIRGKDAVLTIDSVGISIPLARIYDRLSF